MNPETHRLEAVEEPIPAAKKDWKRFDIGEIVQVQGFNFRVLAVDIAKQTIKLKVVKP